MYVAVQSRDIAEPAFRLLRLFLQFLIFFAAVTVCRWGIRTFLLNRGGKSNRWRNSYSAINFVVLVLLLLLRAPADNPLTTLGDSISRLRPESELAWLTVMIVGLYYALTASTIFFLAIYVVGLAYGLADQRIDAWQSRLRASGTIESHPRFHTSRICRFSIHLFCFLLTTALVVTYFLYGFAIFPRTRIFTADVLNSPWCKS